MADLPRIGIVGGGAAGVLAATQILARTDEPAEVVLFEPSRTLGLGIAYSTEFPGHLLNVPAAKMSAFPDRPDDFVEWSGLAPGTFAPRAQYGRYLQHRFEEAIRGATVAPRRVRGAVTGVVRDAKVWRLMAETVGGPVAETVRCLVLAVGAGAPKVPAGLAALAGHERFVPDPWAPGAWDRVGVGDRVVVIGTGLTAIDATLLAASRGANVVAVSRHGLAPTVHGPADNEPTPPSDGSPREIMAWLRSHRTEWRAAVNALRPVTATLWRGFDDAQRRQFLRHAHRYWEIHRHRMAPEVADAIEELRRDARFEIRRSAHLAGAVLADGMLGVETTDGALRANWVVVCTGADDHAHVRRPPVSSLLEAGEVRAGQLGMGIDVDPGTGRALRPDGSVRDDLFVIGALRRGTQWETTAIPEIRAQAAVVADLAMAR